MARMGSGESGAPGKPIKVKRAAPKPKPVVRRSSPPPVTDVQASGGDYGTRKAKAYQKTPAANRPVIVASKQLVRDINTGKTKTVIVRQPHLLHPQGDSLTPVGNFLLHAFASGGGTAPVGGGDLTRGHQGTAGASIGPMLGGPQGRVYEAIKANTKEAFKDPGRTIRDFGGMVAGTVGAAGDVGLPLLHAGADLVTFHPGSALKDVGQSGKAISRFATGAIKDYKYRYGPLVAGDYKTYEKRVHQAGAAPGLVDLATVATAGGAALRPITRGVIKAVPGGKNFLEAPRPKLRTSGGDAISQTLSHKPTRVALQRAQDKVRQTVGERRAAKPNPEGRVPALVPRKSAVAKSVERHNRSIEKAAKVAEARRVRKEQRSGIQAPAETLKPREGLKPPRVEPSPRVSVTARVKPTEVVPVIKHGPADTLGAARAQRIAVSKTSANAYAVNKHEQTSEITLGAERAIANLPAKQRAAVFHVVQGLLPIHGTLKQIKSALADREAQLLKAGAPSSKVPGLLRPHTELATVRYLRKHADEVFGPNNIQRLRDLHAAEIAREKRVSAEHPAMRNATMLQRRYRPQGEMLGINYEPPAATATNAAERDAYNVAYVKRVRDAAHAKGLPEPGYFKHEKRIAARLSNRTAGNVARAVAAPKQSDMALFNEGRAITAPQAYTAGLRDTIKIRHQWPAVDEATHQHAFDWSKGPDGKGLTIDQLLTEIDRRRIKREDVQLINPGRVRAKDQNAAMTAGEASTAVEKGHTDLVSTNGWFAVPKHAGDEIIAATRPARKATRIAGRIQGLQSSLILGLNPSWSQMQLAANTLQSLVGTHGNLGDFVAASDWYKRLSPENRKLVDLAGGIGLYEGHTNMPHLGSYQGGLSRAAERIGEIPLVRVGGRTVRLTDLDPRQQIFRFDNWQNNHFRRIVLYNEIKRQAYRDLIANTGRAQVALRAVSDMLRIRPHEELAAQMDRILANPERVDKAASYVNDVLGDYLRFTHRERTMIKPTIMFYGFMRYATKTLFYTLPIKHPLAAEIALKLGQLHDDEIKAIFGTKDIPPWVFSRVFQYDQHGNVVRDPKTGLPLSIDLARINPLTGPVTDVASEGPKAGFGLFSPMVQLGANLASGQVLTQGRPITVGGSAEKPHSLSLGDMARVGANELLSSTFPGRLLMPKGAQSDDTLPFSPRPIVYKTAAAQAKHRVKDAARLKGTDALVQQAFPLFVPKPDTTGLTAGGGITGKVDQQIKTLNAQKKAMLARKPGTPHAADDGTGTRTDEYQRVLDRLKSAYAQKRRILGVKTKKGTVLRKAPESPVDRALSKMSRAIDATANPDAAMQSKIDKALNAMGGG